MDKWLRLLVIVSTFLVMFVLLAFVAHLLGMMPHTIVLFSLGILLAYALDPLVEWLRHTRLTRSGKVPSRELSVFAVVFAMFVAIGLAGWSLSGFLVKQVGVLQKDYPTYHAELLAKAADADVWLARRNIPVNIESALQHPPPQITALGEKVGGQVVPLIGHFVGTAAESVIVLLIAIYFLIFCHEMRERFNAMLPGDLRERVDLWQNDANRILGGFVRGQALIALLVGALAAVGCLAVGIHLWLIIGLIVIAAAFIPVFGPYLGAIPALLAALIGPTHFHNPLVAASVILVYFLIINEIGSKILYPKLVGEALGLHAVLVLFVLFAGLELGGVLGVLFAAPLTALTMVTVVHVYRYWQDLPDSPIVSKQESEVPVAAAVEKEVLKARGRQTKKV